MGPPLDRSSPQCDLVLLTWNRLDLLRPCIERILRHTEVPSRLIVVDNGSTDPDAQAYLAQLQGNDRIEPLVIRRSQNGAIATALNEGLARCRAEWIGLLNNDILVTEGWLTEMIRVLKADPQRGLVNPMSNQFGLSPRRGETVDDIAKQLRELSGQWIESFGCTGFCLLLSRAAFERVGYFDEAFQPMYFEDADYSIRVRNAGFTCGIAKGAYVHHHRSATIGQDPSRDRRFKENEERFLQKWGTPIPMRIAYLVPSTKTNSDLAATRERIRRLANENHDLWVFCTRQTLCAVPEHLGVRRLLLPQWLFPLAARWKILTKKKKFDRIETDSGETHA